MDLDWHISSIHEMTIFGGLGILDPPNSPTRPGKKKNKKHSLGWFKGKFTGNPHI